MGVAKGALADILDNQIKMYSEPYRAVLCEYTSNGYDSHRAAGTDRPVRVELPTSLSPYLTIQDWGLGLSAEGMELFAQFGETDKDDNDEDRGGFGLGSKSGLGIASRFTVTSVKDGLLNIATVHRDKHGAPVIGFLGDMDQPTDKPNGVTITIPTNEVDKFRRAIKRGLFLGWKPGTIEVTGEDVPKIKSIYDNPDFQRIDDAGWLYTGDPDKKPFKPEGASGFALIAGAGFPINWYNVNPSIPSALQNGLLSRVILDVPNGSVELLRSREGLIYSKTTREVLNTLVESVIRNGSRIYQERIDKAESFRDAYEIFLEARNNGYTVIEFTYQGEELTEEVSVLAPNIDPLLKRGMYNTGWTKSVNHGNSPLIPQNAQVWTTEYSLHSRQIARGETSLKDPWNASLTARDIIKHKHTVLVYGSDATRSPSYMARLREVNSSSVFYAEMKRNKQVAKGDLYLYFTSFDKDLLNPRWASLFTEMVSAETYMDRVRAERRQQTADRRAANPAIRGTAAALQVRQKAARGQYKVIATTWRDVSLEIPTDADKLDTARPHVLLDPNNPLHVEIRRVLTTKIGRRENHRLENGLQHLISRTKLVFVVYNKSDKKPEGLPNQTTIEKLAKKAWKDSKKISSKHNLDQVAEARQYGSMITNFTDRYLAKVKNKDTREWIKTVRAEYKDDAANNAISSESKFQKALKAAALVPQDFKADDHYWFGGSTDNSRGNRYPILIARGFESKFLDDYILYINMKDEILG